jgi:hypothetical protein
MPLYVVGYDLRRETPPTFAEYEKVHAALRTAADWCWPLFSLWIIETPLSPRGVINGLLQMGAIDDNDGVVVLEITGVGDFCRLSKQDAADWLNSRLVRR